MKYSYRGVEYTPVSPSLEVTETEILGSYRGTPSRRRHYAATNLHQPTHVMKYRGVGYGEEGSTSSILPEQVSAPAPKIPDVVPQSIAAGSAINHSRPSGHLGIRDISELEKVHNTFIRQTLEHRLAVAKRKGDQGLIQMLEQEQHQLN
ncbi:DUF4278 domain-containing protein [Acaryochloris sp. IP29b_bin.137]|uniref:DUF4278 domain-containing protein n=1 Tax=Acaryochloris sp. IP29b_bin.137 TaxID=2969217 RepID=UPI0026100581|nr:DUF4278 domain-containing protein [Acaryochloris sp. IP29b_bin.137]